MQTIKQHLLGEDKGNYFQDPGLKDRTEINDVRISLSANPPQNSKLPRLPIANEISPRNGMSTLTSFFHDAFHWQIQINFVLYFFFSQDNLCY